MKKRISKLLKRMLLFIVGLIAFLVLFYLGFVNFYPSFGGDVSKERKVLYEDSKQFKDGIFVNVKDVPKDPSFSEMLTISKKFFFEKVENGKPKNELPINKIGPQRLALNTGSNRIIWFGHSAFLVQIANKNILIDPMFGDVPAPHPWLGGKRFNKELPISIENLPQIEAVLISHDHYDHLDYGSIKKLKDKVKYFYVPLGVGVHLEAWGIEKERIIELDWWDSVELEDLQFVCTPAQHFSGRKFSNGQSTLWSSWVIKSTTSSIFFSGDSGYGPHFTDIGNAYGPFDIAMLECGQYNTMWPDIHMFPEETAQAGVDVQAKAIMPIHWGAFKLAMHSWTDPVERVTKTANELEIPIIVPEIGAIVALPIEAKPLETWWVN